MKDLISMLSSVLDDKAVGTISQQIEAPPQQTRGAINAALPLLLGMMANNCQSDKGCESLAGAIEKDHADGGLLDQAQGFLSQGNISGGEKILGHILGSRQGAAEQRLAGQTGLNAGQAHKLLGLLAPLIMSALGKQSQARGGLGSNQLSGLLQSSLGSLTQGSGGQLGSQILGSLLSGDGGQSGGLAEAGSKLLGGLFKK